CYSPQESSLPTRRGSAYPRLLPCAFRGSRLSSFRQRFRSPPIRRGRSADKAGKSDSSGDYPDRNSSYGQTGTSDLSYSWPRYRPSGRTPPPDGSVPEEIPAYPCIPDRYGYWALLRILWNIRRISSSSWPAPHGLPVRSLSHTV